MEDHHAGQRAEHGMREGTGFVQAGEGLGDRTAVRKYLVGWCREDAGSW